MKNIYLSFTIYFLKASIVLAVPQTTQIKILEGVVTSAVWRDEIVIHRIFIADKSTDNVSNSATLRPECLMILSNVKGVSLKESQDLTDYFCNSNYPIDNFYRRLVIKNQKDFDSGLKLLISIPINNVQNIKIGSKIEIREYMVTSESGTYFVKLEKCLVDGKVIDILNK
jgi:hypothetical protein